MKTVNFSLVLILLIFLNTFSYGQDQVKSTPPTYSISPPTPLVILKSGNETIEFDPAKGDTLDNDALKPEWIESISVLSSDEAKDVYGKKGADGVIIISLKEDQFITRESLLKLRASNK